MKKILYLNHAITHYNTSLVEVLLKKNAELDFSFVGADNFQGIKNVSFEDEKIKHLSCTYLKITSNHTFFYLKGLNNVLRQTKPDIIVFTGIDFHFPQSLIIFLYYNFFTNKKLIWWSPGPFKNQNVIGKIVRKWIYNSSDAIMLYANSGIEILKQIGVEKPLLSSAGNCLNAEDYGFLNQKITSKEKNKLNILFSGRLTKEKEVATLVESLSIIDKKFNIEWQCTIIGEGEEKENIKNQIEKLGLQSKVELLGAKYGKELHSIFEKANLMVLPSAVGLGIVHAYSYGIPLITSNNMTAHGPEIELLKVGVTGDFFEQSKAFDLSNKIIEWYGILSNEANDTTANKCIDQIVKYNYLPEGVANKMIETILSLTKNNNGKNN